MFTAAKKALGEAWDYATSEKNAFEIFSLATKGGVAISPSSVFSLLGVGLPTRMLDRS